jgi:hypothetical protein
MGNGVAIIVGVGVVAGVLYYTRKQEQQTAMLIAQQVKAAQAKASAPQTLSFADAFTIASTVVATYVGGPQAGAQAFQATVQK